MVKKSLNIRSGMIPNMKRGNVSLKGNKLDVAIKEAQKDPMFHKEISKFIKISNSIYKLKDYGFNN